MDARRGLRRPRLTLVFVLALVAAIAPTIVGSAPDAAAAGPDTWVFGYTGDVQPFTVPAGVEELTFIVVGASGGPGGYAAAPGASGAVIGRMQVDPGDQLAVWVGGAGGAASFAGISGAPGGAGGWGFGCGGDGGDVSGFLIGGSGAGGGGSSAVTTQHDPAPNCGTRPSGDAVLAVAGGGGGGGGWYFAGATQDGTVQYLGGTGGDGGPVPGAGGGDPPYGAAPGGCGGCSGSPDGDAGLSAGPGLGSAAGGGGGGIEGGKGGEIAGALAAGGGGGGRSSAGSQLADVSYVAGSGADGLVTIAAGTVDVFECSGEPEYFDAPAGTGWMRAVTVGGHGGNGEGKDDGAPGGAAGSVEARFAAAGGDEVGVAVGCAGGAPAGGWGYGFGGEGGAADAWAGAGGGGGGASAVTLRGAPVVVTAGGGGGGGQGGAVGSKFYGDDTGGAGGRGGSPPAAGTQPQPGGHGGCAACLAGAFGGGGGKEHYLGGGGGAGGAGWHGGGGGASGDYQVFQLQGSGGGGGGGGVNHVAANATDVGSGSSPLTGDGLVELAFTPNLPSAIVVYGGAGQQATIGAPFPEPLAALVLDSSGQPVPLASVEFTLPASGASGTFMGGGTSQTVTTGADGIATSAPVAANLTAGGWAATASVTGVSHPATFPLVNFAVETTTVVTPSSDPATPTETVTATAAVTPATSTSGTPTGDVQFQVDGVDLGAPVALSGGTATSPAIPGLTVAGSPYEITAEYAGTPEYLASTGSRSLPVELTPTATSVSSSANPSIPTQNVTFTATIAVPSGNTPYAGTVQFQVDGVDLGSPVAATAGTATSTATTWASTGSHVVTAITDATADYAGSTGSMHQVVDPDGTATIVSSSANPVEYGAPLTLDATVVPKPGGTDAPTGAVAFTVGATGCTGTLAPAGTNAETSCAVPTALAPGSYDVIGSYGGGGGFKPSTGSMVQQVTKAHTTTTITGAPPNGSIFGQPVTFTATIDRVVAGSGIPTGTVQFFLGADPLGAPVAVAGGQATSPTVTPAAGRYRVTALYSGDASFSGSAGAAAYPVEPAPTSVALAASPEPSQQGQPVTFSADVTAQVPGASPTPTGSVRFRVDGVGFGDPVPLTGGHAVSPSRDDLDAGVHHVDALYLPDTNDFTSSSARIDHDVQEPSATVVASSDNPAAAGSTVTLLAHVGPKAGAGTMSFSVDGAPVASCQALAVVESEARCDVASLSVGAHDVLAVYSGAPTLDPSFGTLTQVVVTGVRPTFTG